ncbi:MAG: hypothetical protein R3263_11180, partial [Myxococcota bacterium]|nr:hypothetical protein [Myxococcota bacterium]
PLADALGTGPPPREARTPHRPSFLWRELAVRMGAALDGMSLDGLCREAAAGAVRRADADNRTYHI